jgi:hypothetical protein
LLLKLRAKYILDLNGTSPSCFEKENENNNFPLPIK